MKKWIIRLLCLIFVLCPCVVSANFMIISATEMDIEITNINDEIKSIWLVVYDEYADVKEAYKDSDLDFSNARFLPSGGYSVPEKYDHCAIYDSKVDPYSKEDYVFNNKYNKKNYYVDQDFSYDYEIEDGFSFGDGTIGKFKSKEDLLNYGTRHGSSLFTDEDIQKIKEDKITCKRSVFYCAFRLIEVKELNDYKIENNTLKYSISDFTKLSEIRSNDMNAGYAFRFETTDGNYKTIRLGTNDLHYDSGGKRPTGQLVKKVNVDYVSGKSINDSPSYLGDELFNVFVHIIIALLITVSVELLVAKFMNIKSYVLIGIVNVLTQFGLHLFTYAIIPILFNSLATLMPIVIIIAEALIVLIEYLLYKLFIKDQKSAKLLTYSLSANFISFGISVILYVFLKI